MLNAMKLWTITATMKLINQVKTAPSFVFDKYFKSSQKGVMGSTVEIPIKKGAGIVLESVSPSAEHLYQEENDAFILTIALPRFPLETVITAADMNELKSLSDEKEQTQALAQKIGEIVGEHKESFMTTLEFMSVGALFGKVMDGKGNTLFEFTSGAADIDFKSDKNLITSLNEIDDALVAELGKEVSFSILADRSFISGVAARAQTETLFDQGQAKWTENDGKRILEVHGVKYIPYTGKYKNAKGQDKQFIATNAAVVVPESTEVFKLYYGRANHTEALNKAPKLFFTAAPEPLPKGRGYAMVSEMRAIPVCIRPGALIKLKWTTVA